MIRFSFSDFSGIFGIRSLDESLELVHGALYYSVFIIISGDGKTELVLNG